MVESLDEAIRYPVGNGVVAVILPAANRPREQIVAELIVEMHAAGVTKDMALYPLLMTIVALLEHDRASIDIVNEKFSETISGLNKSFRLLENRISLQIAETNIELTNRAMEAQLKRQSVDKLDLCLQQLSQLIKLLTSCLSTVKVPAPLSDSERSSMTAREKGLWALEHSSRKR